MSLAKTIAAAEQLALSHHQSDSTGHDVAHVQRVRNLAIRLAEMEHADVEIVELACWLHDIWDHKQFNGDFSIAPKEVRKWLEHQDVDSAVTDHVVTIVQEVSFKGAGVPTPMSTLEGMVVQDADRLDAIGAIGIARAFAFGGAHGRAMYGASISQKQHQSAQEYSTDKGATIDHFYEKLLLLKDRMNTQQGKQLAQDRHAYMERFLDEFYAECEGVR